MFAFMAIFSQTCKRTTSAYFTCLLLPDTLCRFANPALFVGEIRASRTSPPDFHHLKSRAAPHGGETQVFSSVIVGN